jgi:hypothetical protein
MLIHWQNSHAPRSQQHTDRREMQNRGTGHESKKSSLYVVDATKYTREQMLGWCLLEVR